MTRPDLYPSRVGGPPQLLPRKDPIVHALSQTTGPLSASDLKRFERDGFLALDAVLGDAEIRALRAEAERLRETLAGSGAREVITEPEGGAVRSVFAVHRSSSVVARLASDGRLVGAATQVLGSPVYVHQSRINFKPAFRGREFYWHSDFETWHVEDGMPRMRAVSASINLTRNLALNGPLMMIAGSHLEFVSCPGRTPENHHLRSLRRQEYGVPDRELLARFVERGGIRAPTGPPGSVVFFDSNVLHGSNGNITPFPRSNVFFAYNSVENGLVDPFSGQARRPEHIASRDFSPIGDG